MKQLLLTCALWLPALSQAHAAAPSFSTLTAEAYCRATHGVVQTRIPAYGTNNPAPLYLNYPQKFCEYNSTTKPATHIWVALTTLVSTQPTLAALAYYAATKFISKGCNGGPGSCYCAQLGGTDAFGGITIAGGGWVLKQNATDVLDACTFPDLSIIDSYGLFYHSAKIIRGQDLNGLLEYANPNPAIVHK